MVSWSDVDESELDEVCGHDREQTQQSNVQMHWPVIEEPRATSDPKFASSEQ